MSDNTAIQKALTSEQTHLIENMKAEIRRSNVKAVSFKMFETLVNRPFLSRSSIFTFMEKDFSELYVGDKSFEQFRTEAENNIMKKLDVKKNINFSLLDKIYDSLMKKSNISPSSREKLMKRECEIDEYFCFARQCGMELYREAKSAGKKIIITVNQLCPLPKGSIERILKSCGYDDYSLLVYPSECGVTTAVGGSLYNYIPEKMKVSPSSLLHIGSRVILDVEEPIKKGIKPLLLTSSGDLMAKSGRLRAFLPSKLGEDFETEKDISLRCCLALYAAHAFDFPQNKTPQSDFCGDDYMIGFIVLGPLSLYKDFVVSSKLKMQILGAMSKNKNMAAGRDCFIKLFDQHFGSHLDKFEFAGCELPFEFYFNHGSINDRMSLQPFISADVMEKWSKAVTEFEITPISYSKAKNSSLSRFADKLFPPGSQVRTIVDSILVKLH